MPSIDLLVVSVQLRIKSAELNLSATEITQIKTEREKDSKKTKQNKIEQSIQKQQENSKWTTTPVILNIEKKDRQKNHQRNND